MDKLIRVKPDLHETLKQMGKKDETYDQIIRNILKNKQVKI